MRLPSFITALIVGGSLLVAGGLGAAASGTDLVLDSADGPRAAYFGLEKEKSARVMMRRASEKSPEILISMERSGVVLTGRGRMTPGGRFDATLAPLSVKQQTDGKGASVYGASGQLSGKTLDLSISADNGAFDHQVWNLSALTDAKPIAVTQEAVSPYGWTQIKRPEGVKGPVRIRVKGLKAPVGGSFAKPPADLKALRAKQGGLPPQTKADGKNPDPWLPEYIDGDGAAIFLLDADLAIWIGDLSIAIDQELLRPRFIWERYYPHGLPFPICDPAVSIAVTPHRLAVGGEVDIAVAASSEAGINEVSWSTVETPASAGRGGSIPGRGEPSVVYNTSLRLDTAGVYRFRGVASRFGAGGVACYAFDTVEVLPEARRAYKVALVVLTAETDRGSAAYREKLRRANDAKRALGREFSKATDFRGAVDLSYPTVSMAPPVPLARNADGPVAVYEFYRAMTEEFYRTHADEFDFIAFWTDAPERLETFPGGFVQPRPADVLGGRHFSVRNAVTGLGIRYGDYTAQWGSAGRLQGVGALRDVGELPETYSYTGSFTLLALHEIFGHQWGVGAAALRDSGSHFAVGVGSDTYSVLYAQPWRDLGGGRFGIADIPDEETGYHTIKFHPWMLYLAGMKTRAEVPVSIIKVTTTPPWTGNRWEPIERAGSAETITLQSIIDAEGDRLDR